MFFLFFFVKQKTAYEMRISDWSSDVCSSDLFSFPVPHLPEASMIPRYSRPDMVAIWEPESKFRIWFEIEAHATDALAELGVVPRQAAKAIWEKGAFEVDRIDAIAAEEIGRASCRERVCQ